MYSAIIITTYAMSYLRLMLSRNYIVSRNYELVHVIITPYEISLHSYDPYGLPYILKPIINYSNRKPILHEIPSNGKGL